MSLLFEIKEALSEFGMEWIGRYYGVYSAFVHSVEDPDNLGRIQLIVPSIYGDAPYKYWAYPRGLMAGKGIGFFFIPNEGDKVRVSFENGDMRYPIWEHGWWAKGDVPEGAEPEVKIIQTTAGHRIKFSDKAGEESILITDKAGNKFTLDKEGVSIKSDNISWGKYKTSDEKAVLGDTAKAKLEAICDALMNLCDLIGQLTVATAMGASSIPINKPAFDALKQQVNALKGQLNQILSNKVTLDK